MGALMAALVAALLIRATDPSTRIIAILSERTGRPGAMILAALIALIATQGIGAVAGALTQPHLTPNAQQLLLGFALIAAGGGAIWPGRAKPVAETRSTWGAVLRIGLAGMGDRTQFVTFAVACAGYAAFAGVGGVIGGLAVLAAAAIAGEELWRQVPHRMLGYAIGVILVVVGLWTCLGALRLV